MTTTPQGSTNSSTQSNFSLGGLEEAPAVSEQKVLLGDRFRIEWRDSVESGNPVSCDYDQSKGLRLVLPDELGWVRAVIRSEAPTGPAMALVRLEIEARSNGKAYVEPMWMESGKTNPNRLFPVPDTRNKINLSDDVRYEIQCATFLDAENFDGDLNFVINLPQGSELKITAAELVWVPIEDGSQPALDYGSIITSSALDLHNSDTSNRTTSLAQFSESCERFLNTPGKLSDRIVNLLLLGANGPDLRLLELLFDHFGGPCHFSQNKSQEDDHRWPNLSFYVEAFITLISHIPNAEMEDLDLLAIKEISRTGGAGRKLWLTAPRQLQVRVDAASPADIDHWKAIEEENLIDGLNSDPASPSVGQLLVLESGVRLSRINLAAMRRVSSFAFGAVLNSEISEKQKLSSWQKKIGGFEIGGAKREVGRLYALENLDTEGDPLNLTIVSERTREAASQTITGSLEYAYAFVVKTQPDLDLSDMLNIENCRVFDGFEELREALANSQVAFDYKPVVPITKTELQNPGHITMAVQRFWAYAGTYMLTSAYCSFDSPSGKISLRPVSEAQLSPIVLTSCVLCLPAQQLLQADATQLKKMNSGIFVPPGGFAVSVPIMLSNEESWVSQKMRSVDPDLLSSETHELLDRSSSSITIEKLESLQLEHWRLGQIVEQRLMPYKRAKKSLARFLEAPDLRTAKRILKNMQMTPNDWSENDEELQGFYLSLASNPEIYLELPSPLFHYFLKQLKRSPAIALAAESLARDIIRVCETDINYIIPMFEVLAICLSQTDLDHALLRTARQRHGKSNRFTHRISECFKRYSTAEAHMCFALMVIESQPKIAQESSFLKSLGRLLEYDKKSLFASYSGSEFISKIEAEMDINERFRMAVFSENRDMAVRVLNDTEVLQNFDIRALLNEMRAYSNELQNMALSVSDFTIPGLFSPSERLLVALTLRDLGALRDLAAAGYLDHLNEENAMALSLLGDNHMLNSVVAKPFMATDYTPMSINGDSIYEVFSSAQSELSGLPKTPGGPLVTVIMSAFNPDIDLMRQAIGSIQAQTHENLEVIVIDDASDADAKDRIAALVAEFGFASLIRLEENFGPYVGRNLALQRAKGDFIAIQDADDWAHPQRIASQLAVFETTPEAQLVTSQHIRIDLSGKVQMEAKFAIFGDGPMTSLFRRSVFKETGQFALVRSRGDVEMRERIRAFYGNQAIVEQPMPMMLCLAASQTLSQSVKRQQYEYLKLFRSNISGRGSLTHFKGKDFEGGDIPKVIVPHALRVTMPEVQA